MRLSFIFSRLVYHFLSAFSTVFVLHFLENEKRNGNLHGHIVSVNEAHQQSRREDANEVLLEEQITTVNEGRPLTKRNDWYINTDQLQLKFNFQTLSISKFLFLVLLRFLLSLKCSCLKLWKLFES